MGHADAVLDSISFAFPAELIAAYPEAKVILNYRTDIDAWYRSLRRAFLPTLEGWFLWLISRFSPRLYWAWQFYGDMMWPHAFRGQRRAAGFGIRHNAKWVHREHCALVRGLLVGQEERYLEWTVQNGWEPLCRFLGKEVPTEPFPHVNDAHAFGKETANVMKRCLKVALMNMGSLGAIITGTAATLMRRYDLTFSSFIPTVSWYRVRYAV